MSLIAKNQLHFTLLLSSEYYVSMDVNVVLLEK